MFNTRLTELETDKLQQLLGDELMLNIIKKVMLGTVENNKPQIILSDDNQRLGEKYRAYEQAQGILGAAFLDLLSYKKEKVDQTKNLNRGK